MNFLGIDIGTSSICGIVYNTVSKDIVSIAKINNTDMLSCNVWEKVQDANAIVDIVLDLIQELRIQYPDIKGIGLSGQMHGILYVNAEGEAVSPLYTWQDMRGSLLYKDGMSYAAYLSKQTGFPLSTGFGLVTHYYNKVNSLVPQNAVKLCTIMDYTAMRLTGKCEPLVDCSNAASLGFFDKEKLAFDKEALWNVGIDSSILPEIGKAFSRVGHYENISVYTAIGDNQASFLGSIRDIRHSIHITVGTSSQISVYSEDYVNVPLLDTRPLPGGGYILVGAALCGGCSFSLLKKFFSETIKLYTGEEMDDTDLYKIMVSVPYKEVQEDDIRVETLFGGTRSHPEKRGKIMNISCLNWHPENLIRGFLEGMSQELYDFYQLLPNSVRERKTILVGSGNGIKRNPLLCQILEERFKCHLQVSACREEAALGACICGMVGNGYINNFTDFFNENLLIN
ncbi:FGGY family carbohydrate kinase [Parabacteroides distasonis]|nr:MULTISPECIES: FGGY family carbohydrate kinase [Parabacteroides]MDB8994821.1 FGGY family carbohydrate kinase [Parabacteroides distasonis]MDB9070667.1 FGGY family carbohydrate kinase [Parabacteroides distasonis]MDB9180345.1 FGGY family carbohydrate kinase [Parabacteroides distasonis]MDB9216891.1 FGGY family carbohydrate kinase [Parabacteroides distasonis]